MHTKSRAIYDGALSEIDESVLLEGILHGLDGYCLFDSENLLISCSDTFDALFPDIGAGFVPGASYEECIRLLVTGKNLQNVPVVSDIDAWISRRSRSLRSNQDKRYHYHLLDGRWIQMNGRHLSTGHWLFTATEVTQLRTDKEALSKSEEKFKAFATLSSDWFWELDKDLCYLYHSAHNQPLTRIDTTELVGLSRIDTLESKVIKNSQFELHNQLLLSHKPLNTLLTWLDEDGQEIFSRIRAHPKFDNNGVFTGYLGCGMDVTRVELLSRKLEHLAMHDDVTDMLNRRSFESTVTDIIRNNLAGDFSERGNCSMAFVDLDQFKLVNDDGGHQAGDQLLKELSGVFRKICGPNATLARLGGDEFGIVLQQDINSAFNTINQLIQSITSYEFVWNGRRFSVGASAGVTPVNSDCSSATELVSRADIACYSAKRAGRNQVHFYDEYNPAQNLQLLQQQQATLLRTALLNEKLTLFLQPIVPVAAIDSCHHFEALLRMEDESGNFVSCGSLIPAAEKYDLMQQIDNWVVTQVIMAIQSVKNLGPEIAISINLSGNSLSNTEQLARIEQIILDSDVSPSALCFEITETSAIKNISQVTDFILRMKKLGCKFALDDFGSGLSSFSYLKSLPVDYLKIDGAFVSAMLEDHACRAIVSAIHRLGHELDMITVAEFVENDAIHQILGDMGVDYAQGFALGKPRAMYDVLDELHSPALRTGT